MPANQRILIIEDERNLSRFVELELKHEGYETKVCSDGRSGLQAAIDEQWDAILLDLMLPEMNGLEVVRRLRQVKQTPVIIMTARDSVMDRVAGLDQGADDYVVKPFEIEAYKWKNNLVLLNKQEWNIATLWWKWKTASFVVQGKSLI